MLLFDLYYIKFLGCWFVKLNLQYYHIMVCRNTELEYSVIQLLRKHQIDHCLSLLMLLFGAIFMYIFIVIQWVIVLLFMYIFIVIQWVIVLFFMYIFIHSVSHRPVFYVHFQSFSDASSCFFMYIFSHSVTHRPVLRNFMMTCWRL